MRLVMAVVKPAQVEAVRRALVAVQVTRLTICDAQGYDKAAGRLVQQACLEIAVNEDFVDRTVKTIAAALTTAGDSPDGQILVMPMNEAVQLYRTVRGPEAV
jgi:nitrogen regulatory protein P-II 1